LLTRKVLWRGCNADVLIGTTVMDHNIEGLEINSLRKAIRANRVSFPSQVPVFPKHDRADLQRKMVQLYFLLGWSCNRIGARYNLCRQRVQQVLNAWKRRAVQMGYIQPIPPAHAVRSSRPLPPPLRPLRIFWRIAKIR
jgi:hypothetical protein